MKNTKNITTETTATKNTNTTQLFQDVCLLSSGTLANLTGYKKYSQIDKVHNELIEFCAERDWPEWATWQDVWEDFKLDGMLII